MFTVLVTAVVLTVVYLALVAVALVYLGRRLRNPQLAKAVVILLMGGRVKEKEGKDSG